MAGFIRSASAERAAASGIKLIMARLKAGSYKNAAYENADRRMLEIYLNR